MSKIEEAPSPQIDLMGYRPAALAHISITDDEVIADLEVLDGTFLQPEMTPVPLYTKPQPVRLSTGDDLVNAGKGLKGIVDGIDGTMKHGTWRDDHGSRLKDTTEWVRFYNAVSSEGYVLVPVEPTAAMMEAVSGEMAEQRSTHIHIFSADVWAAMILAALTPSPQTNLMGMDEEDRTPVPEGFDAAQWRKADEVHHAMALVASDAECVKILYAALAATEGRS